MLDIVNPHALLDAWVLKVIVLSLLRRLGIRYSSKISPSGSKLGVWTTSNLAVSPVTFS
jgi:hypothetical protein